MPDDLHIASLIVHSRPERAAAIARCVGAMAGAEVHGGVEAGKLIVTLETTTEAEVLDRLDAMQRLDGVLAATLVFHHCEPASDIDPSEVPQSEVQSP